MYITSDLFGGANNHNQLEQPVYSHRLAMTDAQQSNGLGKRKRHDAEGTPTKNSSHYQHLSPASRASPHQRTYHPLSHESNRNLPCSLHPTSPIYPTTERRPVKQMKRSGPKSSLVKSTSHLMDIDSALSVSVPLPTQQPNPVSDLRPCHACQSAPKRRKELENYLDCRRCDERTCYICARQCYGGCGKAVCKKCIVEVGEEGDPWCLDCYARKINT